MNFSNAIILILVPIITGIASSYVTYYFTLRSKRNETILKFKEEKYTQLLVLLQGFIGETSSGKMKRAFFEEQYKSWLYCSDEVVKSINNMVELVINSRGAYPDPNEGKKAIGNIVMAMRKDLLGKTNLNYADFKYTDVID